MAVNINQIAYALNRDVLTGAGVELTADELRRLLAQIAAARILSIFSKFGCGELAQQLNNIVLRNALALSQAQFYQKSQFLCFCCIVALRCRLVHHVQEGLCDLLYDLHTSIIGGFLFSEQKPMRIAFVLPTTFSKFWPFSVSTQSILGAVT